MFSCCNLLTLAIASGVGAANTSSLSPVDVFYTSPPALRPTDSFSQSFSNSQQLVSDFIASPVLPEYFIRDLLSNVSRSNEYCSQRKVENAVLDLLQLFCYTVSITLFIGVQIIFSMPYISTVVVTEQPLQQPEEDTERIEGDEAPIAADNETNR